MSSIGWTLHSTVRNGSSRRNDFKLNPSKAAILVIDVQDHLGSSEIASDVLQNISNLVNRMRSIREVLPVGGEVIITYLEAKTNDCRDISLDYKLSGSKLAHLPTPLNPATFRTLPRDLVPSKTGKGDIFLPKTSCSVFQSTNIDYILRNLQVEQLIITGQLTDQCVMSAVRDAADLGYFVTVVDDACAALNNDDHMRGIKGISGFARVLCTDDILQELSILNETHATVDSSNASNDTYSFLTDEEARSGQLDVFVEDKRNILIVTPISKWTLPQKAQVSGAVMALLNTLNYAKVKFIRFAAVDISNSIRTKVIPVKRLLSDGLEGFFIQLAKVNIAALPAFADQIIPETGIDAKDSLVLQPDFSTFRILPYSPSSGMMFGTMHDQRTGKLSEFCTRGILHRVLDTANRKYGIGFAVGVEIEFSLLRRTDSDADFEPVDTSVFSAPTTLNDQTKFLDDVYEQLEAQGISVESFHAESAPGQLEIVLPHDTDIMAVADRVVLMKETIKEVAKKHSLFANFLPKVDKNQAGNGVHLHLSTKNVSSDDPERNTFPGVGDASISRTGGAFVEGLLTHLNALTAITLPTINSFMRIGPGCWTGSRVEWDIEDKERPIRVCVDSKTNTLTNVEMKLIDNSCNIYLALSVILWAGLDGIVQQLRLRQNARFSKGRNDELPKTLSESLQYLQNDEVLKELLGDTFMRSYCAVKNAEIKHDESDCGSMEYIRNQLFK
jgi:glutamine synthetase